MSIIQRVRRLFNVEQRSDPSWDGAALLAGTTSTGTAESVSAVYACVSAISETVASLPLITYQRTDDDGRERASAHPLYAVLHDQANDLQTALEFRELMTAHMLMRGNAYAEIIRDHAGQVTALKPIHPDRVRVEQLDNGRLRYETTDRKGVVKRLLQEECFHLRHRSDNGILGISPITASRQTIDLALAERDHGNTVFSNGTRLSGVLKFPQKLKPEQRTTLGTSWSSQYGGGGNAGKVAVLEEGVAFEPIGMSNEDAEYLESRKFSVIEICRLFRVPPVIVQSMESANYSNSVELAHQFVTLTLKRHLTAWEQAIAMQLLTPAARRIYFAEHSVEGLLRGDSANRATFYQSGIASGWMTIDEVRQLENLPALKPSKYQPGPPPKGQA